MQVKTYTKRDIAKIVGQRLDISIRKSVIYTDEVFKAVKDLLCKERDYIRVEVRNFGDCFCTTLLLRNLERVLQS